MSTVPTPEQVAAHARRAAALLVHYANKDEAGFNEIVYELETGEDSVRLVLALLGMFDMALPMLLTPMGIAITQKTIADLAGIQYGPPQ